MTLRRRIAVLVVVGALAGCSGSSGGSAARPSPSPSVDTAAEKAAVTATWESFFHAGGTVDGHIALLEDGEKFRTEITASSKDPAAAYLHSKVTTVDLTGPTSAAVTYDLLGKSDLVLLNGTIGQAVKVGGKWLVSKTTYCQLIKLQDPSAAHPGCAS